MITKSVILVVAITLSHTSASVITQNAVSSALQDILSPANTEKALQLIKMAAARSMPCREYPARFASSDYMSARDLAAKEMPVRVISGDGYARVAYPERSTRKIVKQVPGRELRQVQTNFVDSFVMNKEIFQSPVALPLENLPRPCQPPAYNPYLPVASPVSANVLANGMPPPTQSKGQFLRKIPIPPPTL